MATAMYDNAMPTGGSRIRDHINVYALTYLPVPRPEFRLDVLLQQRSASLRANPQFENIECCLAEDKRRAAALDESEWPGQCSEDLTYLPELLRDMHKYGPGREPTFASATCMRDLRLRFLGAVLSFIHEYQYSDVTWVRASHPSWQIDATDEYWNEVQFDWPRQFRSALRIGGVMTAPGFLISCLYGSYDPKIKAFRVEFRGICAGEKLVRFRKLPLVLKDPKNAAMIKDYLATLDGTYEIAVTSRKVQNMAMEISLLMPNTIESIRRAPEPDHSAYLTWLHLYRYQPFVVLSGVQLELSYSGIIPDQDGAVLQTARLE